MRDYSTDENQLSIPLDAANGISHYLRCVFFSRASNLTFRKADDFATAVFHMEGKYSGFFIRVRFSRDDSHVLQRHVAQVGGDA